MGVLEQLRAASAPKAKGVIQQLQEASDPTLGQAMRQTASSFVGGAVDTLTTGKNLAGRVYDVMNDPFGMFDLGGPTTNTDAAIREVVVPEGVPGQEEKLYAQAAGMAGSSVPLAPAALAGPVGLGLAGAGLGAEQGIEAAQAAGASSSDTVYSALGNALIGATQAFGPAKALTRLGIRPGTAGHFLLSDMLTAAGQGAVQSVGSDVVAQATYDPERVVDLGKALETALASMGASGAMGGTVKVLETAARLRVKDMTGATPPEQAGPVMESGAPKAVEPTSKAVESAIVPPESGLTPPLAPAREEAPVSVEKPLAPTPVEAQTQPAAVAIPEATPPAPSATASVGAEGALFSNDHIDTIGRGENKMELVARGEDGKPLGVAEYTQAGDQVHIDMVTVREDRRRQGLGKRLIEEVRKAKPQATINLGMAVSEAGEALRKSSESDLSNTQQAPPPDSGEQTAAPAPTTPEPVAGALPAGKGDDLTGIKHASTEADRAVLGLLEREGRTPKKDADILARARADLEADPHAGQKLIEARESDGRQLNDEEGMLVALELVRIKNERDAAEEAYNKSPDAEGRARIEAARAAYDRTATLAEKSGSEQGAAFRMRRALVKRDYSLAAMERTIQAAKGSELSEQDVSDVKALHERLTKAEKDLADISTKQGELEAENAMLRLKREVQGRARTTERQSRVARNKTRMDEILRELADTKAFAGVDPAKLVKVVEFAKLAIENGVLKFADFAAEVLKAGEHVKPYLEQAWKQAQEERRSEMAAKVKERGDAGAGRYVNEIARSLIESGVTDREALIDELHAVLKKADPAITREQARDALSGYGKFREVSKEETDVTLRQLKQEMQKVAQIEALEKKAAPLKTGFDRGEPSDEYRRLTKKANELRKQLDIKTVDPERQLKTVLEADKRRLENQISDLQYEIDHKTRIVRERGDHPTTPEIEELKKQRDELKRQRDEILNPPAPPKAPDTHEQKLQRDVDRIVRRLAAMDTAKKGRPQGPPTAAEARLLAKLDELRGMLREVQKPAPPTLAEIEARQVDVAMRNVEKSIADYEQRIKAGEVAAKEKKPAPTSPELDAMRARRDALKSTLDEMRDAAKPDRSEEARLKRRIESVVRRLATLDTETKKPEQGPPTEVVQRLREQLKSLNKQLAEVQKPAPMSAEELAARKDAASRKAYVTSKKNAIARLKERQAREDFGPTVKKDRVLSAPEIAIKAEHEKARLEFERKRHEYEQAHRTKLEKVRDAAKEVFSLPKSLFSSFDVSAVGRQGAVLSGSDAVLRPAQLTHRIGRMFRALLNEDYALRVDTEIRNHPLYETAKKAGVELTGHNDALTPREEVFKSHLAEKIPVVGRAVQASERAYSTYLNLLRFDHFRRLLAATDGSAKEAKAMANFVNVATGRGAVGKGKFAAAVNASGTVLWAPRLMISRFQLLFGQPIVGGTARTRALILREYAISLAGLASVYALAQIYAVMNPDEDLTISSDPTLADFGKIKIGDTRIDPLAGLSQTARLVSREAIALSQGADSKENAVEVLTTFLRTKFSPSITVPYELIAERNFAYGQKKPRPATVGEAAMRIAPLSFQDTLDAMEAQGIPKGVALGILSAFGFGLNTYSKK